MGHAQTNAVIKNNFSAYKILVARLKWLLFAIFIFVKENGLGWALRYFLNLMLEYVID